MSIKSITNNFFNPQDPLNTNFVGQKANEIEGSLLKFANKAKMYANNQKSEGLTDECINAINQAYEEIGIEEDKDKNGNGLNSGEVLKYGGDAGAAWCASFVSWLYGEGQGKENNNNTFGYDITVSGIRDKAKKADKWGEVGSYEPKPGDIMIQKNNSSHTGLVVYSDENYVYTIEGNADDAVTPRRYDKKGEAYKKISGYVKMNEWTNTQERTQVLDFTSLELESFENADKAKGKTI